MTTYKQTSANKGACLYGTVIEDDGKLKSDYL